MIKGLLKLISINPSNEKMFSDDFKQGFKCGAQRQYEADVKTLKQEPCEDAISRELAIHTIMGQPSEAHYPDWYAKQIKELPSVQPKAEPKRKGKWVKYCVPIDGEQHYQCTKCKEYFNFGQYGDYYTKAFKYCPNCGAEMKE